ncbi:hypothetical protein [Cloacibacterium normanense]|uniref:hypothetical protein n=1 Tax=Cloacibacterium normanense TaxID=237258 RepID=UPI0035B219BA
MGKIKVFLSENFCIFELYGEILQTEVNFILGTLQIPRTVSGNFMKKTYIQFDAPKNDSHSKKDGLIKSSFKKALVNILTKIIPKANPDFDDKIDEVQYWLVECDNETGIPEREIGLDKKGRIILKMPFKDNYGYWTDNNLLLNDFKEHFVVSEIRKDSFEKSWKLFDKIPDVSDL